MLIKFEFELNHLTKVDREKIGQILKENEKVFAKRMIDLGRAGIYSTSRRQTSRIRNTNSTDRGRTGVLHYFISVSGEPFALVANRTPITLRS